MAYHAVTADELTVLTALAHSKTTLKSAHLITEAEMVQVPGPAAPAPQGAAGAAQPQAVALAASCAAMLLAALL